MLAVGWGLEVQMARRKLSGPTMLQAALARVGWEVSLATASRLITRKPKRLDFETLGPLCEALTCLPGDLLPLLEEPSPKRRRPGPPPTVRPR